tara:strand:+ start:2253 stop:2987 length:735 start_codon:yes stop_codon:yes gene_type:complete
MLKRTVDIFFSVLGLTFLSPILIIVALIVFLQDFHNPFYIAPRVGKNRKVFKMVKLRSMIVSADKSGVDSTSSDDSRITWIGKFIRKLKLDELTQLWNVVLGDMSLVGPRPNVERDVNLYTPEEFHLLDVRPGITDYSSIIFSDEGNILVGSEDPDLKYNQLIRPWKSRLGLFYIKDQNFFTDLILIILTVFSALSKKRTLLLLSKILKSRGADEKIIKISLRNAELIPYPPPGSKEVVKSRTE